MPSRLALSAWIGWLALAVVAILGAEALGWPLRLGLCVGTVTMGWRHVGRFVGLRGPRAIRRLEWDPQGSFFLCTAEGGQRLPAVPAGCRRYGIRLWILRFETTSGVYSALLDAAVQEPRAVRRLSRRLGWGAGGYPGRPEPGS